MKAIATINFRGGVGKTTVSWLLAKYVADKMNKKVLVIDIDAQMSLTAAVQMEEDKGRLNKAFEHWNSQHKKTLFSLIEGYEKSKGEVISGSIGSLIYKMSENLHFIPSSVDLYWMEFDINDREKVKSFFKVFLSHINKTSGLNYDYIFFDCPPNFNVLSYSVLSSADMILIPVNPEIVASKYINLMLEGLKSRLNPWPNPNIAVFMNKARTLGDNYLTTESKKYLGDIKRMKSEPESQGLKIEIFDCFIPKREDIGNMIYRDIFPSEFEEYCENIWKAVNYLLRQPEG